MQGKSAVAFLLSNYYPVYCSAANADFGMAMLPRIDDGVQSGMYLNSNMYWCISANSANPEAASAVLNYLINDTSAAKVIGIDRGISLSSAVRDALANAPDADVYSSNVLNYVGEVSAVVPSVNPADPANSAELIAVLKNDFIAVTYGEMSAEDCVADFIEQSTAILPQQPIPARADGLRGLTAAHAVEALDCLRDNDVELMPAGDGRAGADPPGAADEPGHRVRGHQRVLGLHLRPAGGAAGVRDNILKPVGEASPLSVLKAGRDAWEQKRLMRLLQSGGQHCSPTVTRLLSIAEEEIANEELSLRWLSAEKMYLNENYLSKLFQKEMHQRFSACLLERRMLLAMRLMLHGPDILIQAVARETGFGSNAQRFSIASKKHTGYTPTDDRRMMASRPGE